MAKRYVRVTFDDGREEEYRVRPAHMIAAEETLGSLGDKPYKATLYAAYKSANPPMPFEVWVDTVDDLAEAVVGDAVPSTETG